MVLTFGDEVGECFALFQMKNCNKIRKNWRLVVTVGDDIGKHFQSVEYISIYSNLPKNSQKKIRKIGKNWNMMLIVSDDVV